jgi:hypothetical protein
VAIALRFLNGRRDDRSGAARAAQLVCAGYRGCVGGILQARPLGVPRGGLETQRGKADGDWGRDGGNGQN